MKYIIIKELNLEFAVLFNECLTHVSMAGNNNVISAGFCSLNPDNDFREEIKATVWGSSVTLKKSSRLEDEEIIERSIKFRG
jgi:hypothetical protein